MSYDPYKDSSEKGKKGGNFLTFDWSKTSEKLEFQKFKKDEDRSIDIIPYKIKGKKHPALLKGAEIGDPVYSFDFWVHKNVGVKKATIICPSATFGKACPICEEAEKVRREEGWQSENLGPLLPKHRVIYNTVDPDDDECKLKIFEESFSNFEQEMLKVAEARGRKAGKLVLRFGDIEEGWTVSFTVTMTKFKLGEYAKYSAFDFEKRDEPHSKKLMDKALSFEEFIITMSYDEIQALYLGMEDDDADDVVGDEAEQDTKEEEENKVERKPKHSEKETQGHTKDEEKGRASVSPECPVKNGTFGVTWDDFKKCPDCEFYTECRAAFKKAR
jgi:hypothetical protein